MIKTRLFENTETLIAASEDLLKKTLRKAGNLMLSGGSTPYVIYDRLASNPFPVHPDRRLFLSDERMMPFDSDKNNAHNLRPMLNALDCEDRFLRIDTSLPVEQAAAQFESSLHQLNPVDVGLLGMGSDGHTAGFFTPQQAAQKEGPLALFTERPDGMTGISVTAAFLKRVKRLILLVTGEPKRDILHILLTRPDTIAAGIALSDHPGLELWTDVQLSL